MQAIVNGTEMAQHKAYISRPCLQVSFGARGAASERHALFETFLVVMPCDYVCCVREITYQGGERTSMAC